MSETVGKRNLEVSAMRVRTLLLWVALFTTLVAGITSSPASAATTRGEMRWSTSLGAVLSSPTVAKGVVFVGAADSKLTSVDAVTGAIRWQTTLSLDPPTL